MWVFFLSVVPADNNFCCTIYKGYDSIQLNSFYIAPKTTKSFQSTFREKNQKIAYEQA